MLDENFALKRFFLRLFGACVDLMFMIDDWFKSFFSYFSIVLIWVENGLLSFPPTLLFS